MDSVTAYEQGLVQEGVDKFNDALMNPHTAVTEAVERALLHVILRVYADEEAAGC